MNGPGNEIRVGRDGGRHEQVFADLEFRPVRDADGAVAGVLPYAADVTAHVRVGRRVKALTGEPAATEERYQTLAETMQGALQENASLLDRLRDANVLGRGGLLRAGRL